MWKNSLQEAFEPYYAIDGALARLGDLLVMPSVSRIASLSSTPKEIMMGFKLLGTSWLVLAFNRMSNSMPKQILVPPVLKIRIIDPKLTFKTAQDFSC